MKFTSTIVLALAGFAAAKGNNKSKGNGTVSTESQCKQVSKLTQLTNLAANTTKLAQKTDNNATKIAEIQAKASTAATKLATLQSNATLMDACNVIFAEEDMVQQCNEMAFLDKANEIVNNATLLAKHTDDNATKADAFKAKVASKQADLTAMESNTTLTAFCATRNTEASCKAVAKLNKAQALVANTTALSEKFAKSDNATEKMAKFEAKVAKMATKLSAMMSNTTLFDTCQSLGIKVAATQNTTSSSGSSSTDSTKSAAGAVSVGSGQMFAAVLAVVYALTML